MVYLSLHLHLTQLLAILRHQAGLLLLVNQLPLLALKSLLLAIKSLLLVRQRPLTQTVLDLLDPLRAQHSHRSLRHRQPLRPWVISQWEQLLLLHLSKCNRRHRRCILRLSSPEQRIPLRFPLKKVAVLIRQLMGFRPLLALPHLTCQVVVSKIMPVNRLHMRSSQWLAIRMLLRPTITCSQACSQRCSRNINENWILIRCQIL